jgi:hypothetical protein
LSFLSEWSISFREELGRRKSCVDQVREENALDQEDMPTKI